MATTPKFLGPDGVYRETFIFHTTVSTRFFTGSIDADTIYMQISAFGSAFEDDPDLITFEGASFTVPNPSKYPDGLQLLPGDNTIKVRSINTTGDTSGEATVTVRLVQANDVNLVVQAPTGITVEKMDGLVKVGVSGIDSTLVTGYNFYAATATGGGSTGYHRINVNTITTLESVQGEDESELGELDVDATVAVDTNGIPLADPQLFRIQGSQEDRNGTTLEMDFNERVNIPETVTKIRIHTTVSSVKDTSTYYFFHDRNADTTSTYPAIPVGELASTPQTEPIYYTVTAVYYDSTTAVEVESPMSMEIPGYPLRITTSVGSFPMVTRPQIVKDGVVSIYRSNPGVSTQPGSVLRDTFLDPFSTEAERVRFILDFIHKAQSFSTLLAIDDPNFTGFSIAPDRSNYKIALAQAFRMSNLNDVQTVIDSIFEKLASNYGKSRLLGKLAKGEATFYTTKRPSRSIPIPIGTIAYSGSVLFRTSSAAEISISNIASFYNAATGRYSVRAFIQAEEVGTGGNVPAGQITGVRGITGVFVTNEAKTYGGYNRESNRELAVRCQGALTGLDGGTRQGYTEACVNMAGVSGVNVIPSGDALMKRDYDSTLGRHIGGKVDIWVRGENSATVSDTFAFTYEIAYGVNFEIVGDPQGLTFRAVPAVGTYPTLTPSNPLVEMLDFPANTPPLGFRSVTSGMWFSLTGVTYPSFDTIQLSSAYNDPANVTLTDVFQGDYRYRTSNKHIMSRQPVTALVSLIGETGATGTVDPDTYALYRQDSPLLLGLSSMADDYIQVDSPTASGRIGQILTVTGETHVILGDYVEYLNFFGSNILTIEVWNVGRTVQYQPVATGVLTPDYRIIVPSDPSVAAIGIQRTETSTITSGQSLLIDYEHDENFTVAYRSNALVSIVQADLEPQRRLTADVVVKQAIKTLVDVGATVVLLKGSDPSVVDRAIRTNITSMFAKKGLGSPLRVSDVIETIKKTTGVSYVVVPLTTVARAVGTTVLAETLDTSESGDLEKITAWGTSLVDVYLIKDVLSSPTSNGGGAITEFRGVTQDETALNLLTGTLNSLGMPLKAQSGNAYIVGNDGLVIPGYSDDATLQIDFPDMTDVNERYAQGVLLTKNRVLISLPTGGDPTDYTYAVTYKVEESTGVQDIRTTAVEYLTAGDISLTYDEDTENSG